jgi:hypothetical protein
MNTTISVQDSNTVPISVREVADYNLSLMISTLADLRSAAFKQIGNVVPPLIWLHIAKSMKTY